MSKARENKGAHRSNRKAMKSWLAGCGGNDIEQFVSAIAAHDAPA
jgi:hypothetical protein